MSIVFLIHKFTFVGGRGPGNSKCTHGILYAFLVHLLVQVMYIACTVCYVRTRTLFRCLSMRASLEVCHVQCTEIVTEQSVSVCGKTSVLLQTVGRFVLHGR